MIPGLELQALALGKGTQHMGAWLGRQQRGSGTLGSCCRWFGAISVDPLAEAASQWISLFWERWWYSRGWSWSLVHG